MGRKRRSSAGTTTKAKEAPGASIKKMETYEDTLEAGGVDDYMFKRDQIMFDPRAEESDDDVNADGGDEVLGLNVHKFKSGGDEEVEEDYEEDEEEWPQPKQLKRLSKEKPDRSKDGRFGKEESDSDDFTEEEEGSEDGSGSESEEEGWGRQYYSRPSTRREKEDEGVYDEKREEERDLEEKEVRKLQKRARETLAGAEDWGLDDVEVEYAAPVEEGDDEEAPAAVAAPETDDAPTLLRHLALHEPLKLALARDFPLVVRKLRKTSAGIEKMEAEATGEETLHKGLGYLHYQALLAYATTLAFYIHLCALPADERPDLSTHPIINRLLDLKQGLAALEDLDFDAGSVSDKGPDLFVRPGMEDEEDDEDMAEAKRELMARMFGELPEGAEGADIDLDDFDAMDEDLEDGENLWHQAGLEDDELAGLLADQAAAPKEKKDKKDKKRKRGKKKSAQAREAEEEETPSAAFTPIAEPEFVATKKSKKGKKVARSEEDETLGDLLELTDADAGDKEHRKRTLQFHTQKIASMSARRSAARERRSGGDDDIPYRNRQAARDAALRKNQANIPGGEGADLDGSAWDDSDRKRAREVRDEAGFSDDEGGAGEGADELGEYYDLVKRRKTAKEGAKAEAHEAQREAKFAAFQDETSEGPRGVTRAIEKNRGLTPRRSKTGRNPRVKKKLAYEKAKQKVGSQRAVYKGGEGALSGQYSGEKSGITTVTKSRKF